MLVSTATFLTVCTLANNENSLTVPVDQFEFLNVSFPIPVSLASLVVNIALATETWNLFNVDLTQVCSCLILPHALTAASDTMI